MKKTKLPDYVVVEIERCLKNNQKEPLAFWRKFIGVGDRAIELIRQKGVIREERLVELKGIEMARQILLMNGFETMEQILKGVLDGKIYTKAFRNYGTNSHLYVCEILIRWLNSKK